MEALSALEFQVADLKNTESVTSDIEALKSDLASLISSQSVKIDGIKSSLAEKQKPNKAPVFHQPKSKTNSPQFIHKLEIYINKGKFLSQKQLNVEKEKLESWIGEVYFFVSMMPSKDTDLNIVKSQLHKIYSSQKPFTNSKYRLNQTIMVLNAVHSWAKIPG